MQGWNLLKKEFETTCRKIAQMGYALFFISHDKDKEFTMRDGTKYNQVVPTCPTSLNEIAKDMADIYAYAEKYSDNGLAKVRLILRSLDNSVDTGCRFKYIEPVIEMEYSALVKALNNAIDTEAALNNNEFVTDEREQITEVKNLDYDALMSEFNTMVKTLLEKDAERYSPRITFIVEKYFGVGKKISEATMAQVDFVYLVVTEIREELYSKL